MLVAGAMAGSCVSLMKHWEGCCLFQGSGGSLACQDAPPGAEGQLPKGSWAALCSPTQLPSWAEATVGPSLGTTRLSAPLPPRPRVFGAVPIKLPSSKSSFPRQSPHPFSQQWIWSSPQCWGAGMDAPSPSSPTWHMADTCLGR